MEFKSRVPCWACSGRKTEGAGVCKTCGGVGSRIELHDATVEEAVGVTAAFLSTPAERSESWPDIPDAEFSDFVGVVNAIVEAKWGRDCDGHSPIDSLFSRKRLDRIPAFVPVPRGEPAAEFKAIIRNLEVAAGPLGSTIGRYVGAFADLVKAFGLDSDDSDRTLRLAEVIEPDERKRSRVLSALMVLERW